MDFTYRQITEALIMLVSAVFSPHRTSTVMSGHPRRWILAVKGPEGSSLCPVAFPATKTLKRALSLCDLIMNTPSTFTGGKNCKNTQGLQAILANAINIHRREYCN